MKVSSVTLTFVERYIRVFPKESRIRSKKMQRMTMLLVYAAMFAACTYANPYSRVSDQHTDFYNQYSDKNLGVNSAAVGGQSYSSASSGSYDGYASAASSSSSYSANTVNAQSGFAHSGEFKSQFVNGQKHDSTIAANSAQFGHRDQEYWWMNANNNPFELNKQSQSGCNSNQCSSGGDGGAGGGDGAIVGISGGGHGSSSGQSDVNIQGNPFLQGSINIESTDSTNQHEISKNPFFNGVASSGAGSSVSLSTNINYATNQFQHNYDGKFSEIGQKSGYKHNDGNFKQFSDQGNIGGGLSVSCSGHGKICVAKYRCVNGYVSGSAEEFIKAETEDQQCDIDSEVCCALKTGVSSSAIDQNVAGTFSGSHSNNQAYHNENNGIFQHHYSNDDASNQANGGIFGQFNNRQHEIGLNSDNQHGIDVGENSNGYLPPIGSEPSSNVPAFSKPPQPDVQEDNIPSPSGPAPTHVQLGCAAALICVEEQYCGMDGMISPKTLSLTSEQLIRRVPLSDCKNPDNGVIGKCCRDPNYVDPWPTGNLPANYTGGFDEQGFPSFLNFQRTRPTKKPTNQPPIKSSFSQVKNTPQVIVNPGPTQQFGLSRPALPPQFPKSVSNVKEVSSTVNIPITTSKPIASQPNFPNFSNSLNKNKYDESSSNTNPIVIAPQITGVQCGVKNSVQRPSGLTDVDVGFGEIPWEAMILWNREKKLLCSGAIIAPNAVLTAARCVDKLSADEVSIKAGEWKLGYELKHEEPLPFEIVQVKSIELHPRYQPNYPLYDQAVLILNHSVKFDQHVGTICTRPQVQQSEELFGKKCISTGWGKHVLQSHLAGAIMHSIDIDVISQDECQERVSNAETPIEINDSLVCTKAHRQNNNMCQVDLGGPLACDRGDGIYEIVGVYNQDTGCLPTNQVATFATIDKSWIELVMSEPPKIELELHAPAETSSRNVAQAHYIKDKPCECQQSNLSPEDNQYLPPV